jgi:hypothetical protein
MRLITVGPYYRALVLLWINFTIFKFTSLKAHKIPKKVYHFTGFADLGTLPKLLFFDQA